MITKTFNMEFPPTITLEAIHIIATMVSNATNTPSEVDEKIWGIIFSVKVKTLKEYNDSTNILAFECGCGFACEYYKMYQVKP